MNDCKAKRILFVHHGKGIGGAPRSMSQLAKRMQKDGFDVCILLLHNSEALRLFEGIDCNVVGLPLLYFNHSSRWYKISELHLILFQIFSWLLTVFFVAPYWLFKLKPDAIYFNSSVFTDWSFAAKLLGIRNLVHVREAISAGYFGIRRKFIKGILDFSAEKIIFLSKHNYGALKTKVKKSVIVHNYVDSSAEERDVDYEKEYDFIYVGGSREIKGIELVEQLLAFDLESKFCLLGYYEDGFVDRYAGRKNIDIVGVVRDPMPYIEKTRALLFPATTPHFPRPVIEALSSKTIPIVSDLDGISEIVSHGVDGFVFENNNLPSLLSAIEALKICDSEAVRSSGFDAYKRKFSLRNEELIIHEVVELVLDL